MKVKIRKASRKKLAALVPHPARDANKYTRGKLTIVGGSAEYPGAACLAALAGERMGAGYVEVACARETVPIVHAWRPSVVARAWDGWSAEKSGVAQTKKGHPQAVLVGSGMTGSPSEEKLVLSVLNDTACPIVVDGGAIAVLASAAGRTAAEARTKAGRTLVATPHFGEATKLANGTRIQVPASNSPEETLAEFAHELARAYNATIALKGPVTFIAECSSNAVYAMRKGSPALAKAGTGDVLAGMIASLLAQGIAPVDACTLGSTLHALSARAASAELTDISVCAEDIVDFVPKVIADLCA